MSFYSSAKYFRPGGIPRITGAQLEAFLRQLMITKVCGVSQNLNFTLNWGDPDIVGSKPFYKDIPIDLRPRWKRWLGLSSSSHASVHAMNSVDADIDLAQVGWQEILEQLEERADFISSMSLTCFDLPDDLIADLDAAHPSGEALNFRPDSWSIALGPVELSMLQWEGIGPIEIGGLAFEIHGYGYFFPWSFDDWVNKFARHPQLLEVTALCREAFPVAQIERPPIIKELSATLSDGWPYHDSSEPLDWAWGPQES